MNCTFFCVDICTFFWFLYVPVHVFLFVYVCLWLEYYACPHRGNQENLEDYIFFIHFKRKNHIKSQAKRAINFQYRYSKKQNLKRWNKEEGEETTQCFWGGLHGCTCMWFKMVIILHKHVCLNGFSTSTVLCFSAIF